MAQIFTMIDDIAAAHVGFAGIRMAVGSMVSRL
jgi:hypothetical protein